MNRKFAICESEYKAIKAIEALQEAGVEADRIKVLAKNQDHTRRVESETSVHADELDELMSEEEQNPNRMLPMFGALGATTSGSNLTAGPAAIPAVGGASGTGAAFFAPFYLGDNNVEDLRSAIAAMGIEERDSKRCGEAVRQGSLVVIAETDEQLLADKAEACLQSVGAEQVW